MAQKIDAKLLKGLQFDYVEKKTVKKDGRDVVQNIRGQRPLTPDDVLDWKDYGAKVVIVTADGQKHTVEKVKDGKPA